MAVVENLESKEDEKSFSVKRKLVKEDS